MSLTGDMKWAAMSWLRMAKGADIVCTEVGNRYLKDVCGLWIGRDGLPTSMVEIEIKSSLSDLKREFETKSVKHEWYAVGRNSPNYLYYVVPKSLADRAKEYLNTKNIRYGVLSFDAEYDASEHPFDVHNSLTSVHRCRKLTDARPKPSYMHQMGRRLMNEYMLQQYDIRISALRREMGVEFYAKALTKRDRGRNDKYCPLGDAAEEGEAT